MTFKDQMADDVANVFLNTDDFADSAVFHPKGGTASFAVSVLMQEPAQEFVQADTGVAQTRHADALGLSAVIRTGIGVIEGTARAAQRGDVIVFASGDYQGSWKLISAEEDNGGAVNLKLALDSRWAAAGPEARRV